MSAPVRKVTYEFISEIVIRVFSYDLLIKDQSVVCLSIRCQLGVSGGGLGEALRLSEEEGDKDAEGLGEVEGDLDIEEEGERLIEEEGEMLELGELLELGETLAEEERETDGDMEGEILELGD